MSAPRFLTVNVILCSLLLSCHHRAPIAAIPTSNTGPITLPSGSTLALRTAESIDSTLTNPDRAYAAVISRDVANAETQTVLPSGSPLTLVLLSGSTSDNAQPSWRLGLSSVTLNGDAFLVRSVPAPLGSYLGGVPGPFYPSTRDSPPRFPADISLSPSAIQIAPGSLLTFRLEQDIVLNGSKRNP